GNVPPDGPRAVDILAEGVEGDWAPTTRLQIIKPVREVTLSVWKVMLHLRRAWMLVPPSSQQPPSTSQRRTSSAAYTAEPGATPSPPRGATALRDELEAPIPLSSIHNGGGDDNGNGGS
ncbi:unnamed protein product, partial [Sphacelaria rigidula]